MRLGKKRTAPRSPECESLESYIQPRPEWPYYTAIRSAFIKRFARWYLSASGSRQLEKEWTTLATQLFRHPPNIPNRDWRKLPTNPQIIRVLRHALRVTADQRRKGRPISDKRRAAAVALDLHCTDRRRWTWRSLTNHLCNCGLKAHPPNSNCQKDLRRETVRLKKELKTMGIKVPQRHNL
jgi:hypothetical protein